MNIEEIPPFLRESAIPYTKSPTFTGTFIGQTKKHSFVESIMNVLVGFGIAIAAQLVIFPLYNIHIPIQSNLAIGGWMTLISIIRSYVLRRWFNRVTINKIYR